MDYERLMHWKNCLTSCSAQVRKDKGGAGYKSMGGGGGGKSNGSTAQPSRLTMSRLEQVFIDEDVVIVMVDVFSGVPPFITWWPPCRGPSFSYLITSLQVPSLPANFGVKKLLSGEPASPLVNDTMSVASGYSTVTGTVIGPSVIARFAFFDELFCWRVDRHHCQIPCVFGKVTGTVIRPVLLTVFEKHLNLWLGWMDSQNTTVFVSLIDVEKTQVSPK